MIEQDRAEGEEAIPPNGALLNISDYTQLGKFCVPVVLWFV